VRFFARYVNLYASDFPEPVESAPSLIKQVEQLHTFEQRFEVSSIPRRISACVNFSGTIMAMSRVIAGYRSSSRNFLLIRLCEKDQVQLGMNTDRARSICRQS
jgi:hypothetical protein